MDAAVTSHVALQLATQPCRLTAAAAALRDNAIYSANRTTPINFSPPPLDILIRATIISPFPSQSLRRVRRIVP